jgi:LAS superfamily LD-carboxypeptidase LdcB
VKTPLRLLTGQDNTHVIKVAGLGVVHHEVVQPLKCLQAQALNDGFHLAVVSGYRSFARQLAIWNAKAVGERPVLDSDGKLLDLSCLSDRDKVFAILRWSALPGGSRHHWGTDVDVWDPLAAGKNYDLQLIVNEYQDGGPFSQLSHWLDGQITSGSTEFFRPYRRDTGGIAPEPWHLSYRPIAQNFQEKLTADLLASVLEQSDIELKEEILVNLDEICARFLCQ